jgi:putative protease
MGLDLPEILAPAGDDECLSAALSAGADAVYFGLNEGLNARARADNFSLATLASTVDRIHRAGARAYVTLNTLIFEEELPAVEAVLRGVAEASADAVIVQDPAVALLARQVAPDLEVHASTQMTISSAEGAQFAQHLGVRRIVVPRELSVEQIARLAKASPIELEVFVHGALCMSWSGQCLTSEAWGGRSANRGQCAQSCRLPYRLVVDDEVRDLGDVRYLLSPRDLAGAEAFPALLAAGVSSFKIEGRLKGPAYVFSTVKGYQRWRDAVVHGEADSPRARDELTADLHRMEIAFSRGFSSGFLAGTNHQTLVEGRFPKHRGALIGEVVEVSGSTVRVRRTRAPDLTKAATIDSTSAAATPAGAPGIAVNSTSTLDASLVPGNAPLAPTSVTALDPSLVPGAAPHPPTSVTALDASLVPGAGVGFDTGRPEEEEPGGPLFGVEKTAEGYVLRFGRPGPDLSRVRRGHLVWLSSSQELQREARSAIGAAERGIQGRVPVVLRVTGHSGEPLQAELLALGLVGRNHSVVLKSDARLTAATGRGLTDELLAEKLGGLGGTAFSLIRLERAALAEGLHVPVTALKSLRRQLCAALESEVFGRVRRTVPLEKKAPPLTRPNAPRSSAGRFSPPEQPTLVPLVRTTDQLDAVISLGVREVELDWMELVGLERAVAKARAAGLKVIVATTRVQKPGEEGYDSRLWRLAPDGVLVRHWGALVHFSNLSAERRPVLHGDFSLNVTNSVTARHLFSLGCDSITPAFDLDEAQLRAMLRNIDAAKTTVTVHHHMAMFHTEHCVYAHTLSRGADHQTCGRPCEAHRLALQDDKKQRHPVIVDVGCRNTVFNAQAQSAAMAAPRLLGAGVRRFRAEFVWEDGPTCAAVVGAWERLLGGTMSPNALIAELKTHEQFGVTAGTMRTMRSSKSGAPATATPSASTADAPPPTAARASSCGALTP